MVKSIIKEILIVILLTIAVILVLGIIFYDYNPTSKVLPSKREAYELPNEISTELATSINKTSQNIVKTYQIDATDLDVYENRNEYDSGKVNPFADYTVNKVTAPTDNTISGGNNTGTGNTNTSGTFFNTVGK